jgi:hypothetical protein
LGRYTHKIAISNHRIKEVNKATKEVTFSYKGYKQGAKAKELTLSNAEFIRRFSQYILPKGFTRIRHYGILSSGWKKGEVAPITASIWSRKLLIRLANQRRRNAFKKRF